MYHLIYMSDLMDARCEHCSFGGYAKQSFTTMEDCLCAYLERKKKGVTDIRILKEVEFEIVEK